jgi:hypothetical protein
MTRRITPRRLGRFPSGLYATAHAAERKTVPSI